MKSTIIISNAEIKSAESFYEALKKADLINQNQYKLLINHEDIHEAHKGFEIIANNDENGYSITVEIPEWVIVDVNGVCEKHIPFIVSLVATCKAAANTFNMLCKSIKKDFDEMFKKHDINIRF